MRIFVIILFICSVYSVNFAAIYQIPEPLKIEAQQLKQQYEASPNVNLIRFNYAMNCAYTGRIEKGWGLLKELPLEYASTVITLYSKNSE